MHILIAGDLVLFERLHTGIVFPDLLALLERQKRLLIIALLYIAQPQLVTDLGILVFIRITAVHHGSVVILPLALITLSEKRDQLRSGFVFLSGPLQIIARLHILPLIITDPALVIIRDLLGIHTHYIIQIWLCLNRIIMLHHMIIDIDIHAVIFLIDLDCLIKVCHSPVHILQAQLHISTQKICPCLLRHQTDDRIVARNGSIILS